MKRIHQAQRAGFATKNLWVTPYSEAEARAAGWPNLHPGGAGLVFLRIRPEEKDRLRDFIVGLMVRRATERGADPRPP